VRRRANTVPSILLASAVSLAAAVPARAQTGGDATTIDPYAADPVPAAAPLAAPEATAPVEDIDEVVARALYQQAMALFDQGRYADARQLFFESLARSPDGADAASARQMRARCEQRMGMTAAVAPAAASALPALRGFVAPVDPYGATLIGVSGPIDPYATSTGAFDGPIDPYVDSVPAGELLDPYSARADEGARLAVSGPAAPRR
jgi:hypothetical protein